MPRDTEGAFGRFAQWLVRAATARPRTVVVAAILLTVCSGFVTATRLELDSDPDRMTSPDLDYRRTNARIEQDFPQLVDNLVVMVEADGAGARAAAEELADRLASDPEHFSSVFLPGYDPYFDRNGLLYLEPEDVNWLASELSGSGPVLADLAERPHLAELAAVVAEGLAGREPWADPIAASSLWLEALARTIDRWLAGDPQPLAWGDLLRGNLRPEISRQQLLVVQPSRDYRGFGPARESIAAVRNASAALTPRSGLRVRVTGDVAVLTEEMAMVKTQIVIASLGSLLLVSLVLWWTLRSFRLFAATLVTLVAGLFWTAGFATLSIGHLNLLTMAFAVLYIGMGVDFGIHFALGFRERRAHGDDPTRALEQASHVVGGSMVFCALTTAVGFFAFVPTPYTGVAELGIISGVGILLSLLATLTLTPALLELGWGVSPKLASRGGAELGLPMPRWPLTHPRWVAFATIVAVAFSVTQLPALRFDGDPLNVRDPRVEPVVALVELLESAREAPWTVELIVPGPDEAEALRPELEALPEVGRVVTVRDFLPADADAKRALLAQALAALESPGAPDTPTLDVALARVARELGETDPEDPFAWDPGATALAESLKSLARRKREGTLPGPISELEHALFAELPGSVDQIRQRLKPGPSAIEDLPEQLRARYLTPDGRARIEIFPAENLRVPGALDRFSDAVRGIRPDAGGAVVASVEFARAITSSLRTALALAVFLIALLLVILWRDWRTPLLALTPLLLGALFTAAATVVLDLPLNFANVIVLPLVLGISVDGGIHLVHRYRLALQEDADLLRTSTARAVFFSTLTSVASFATLAFASHRGISSLSQLLVTGLVVTLVCNLLVLPALLAWFEPRPDR